MDGGGVVVKGFSLAVERSDFDGRFYWKHVLVIGDEDALAALRAALSEKAHELDR